MTQQSRVADAWWNPFDGRVRRTGLWATLLLGCLSTWDARVRGADTVPHADNAVYQQLLAAGITTVDGQSYRLPAPTIPDGLTAARQQAILKDIVAPLPLDRFTRDSLVAPHICRMEELRSDDTMTVRRIDFWFVVHADLAAVKHDDFLTSFSDSEEAASEGHELTAAELQARGISVTDKQQGEDRRELFAQAMLPLLNRVELQITGWMHWSESDDSIVAATLVDPRFRGDAEYPNRWRPLTRQDDGTFEAGPPRPYEGAGCYVKVTRLADPAGSVIFEGHTIYTEPYDWFDGKNLLRAKIPAIAQTQIRATRREMIKSYRAAQARR